jgi:hypothetical protein
VLPLWWSAPRGGCACGRADCDSVAKHPVRRLVPHGLLDASSEPALIVQWWRSVPYANLGIRTGAESALVVIDVDGATGLRTLRQLTAAHAAFRAAWSSTGSGGWHAYFAHPGAAVPSSAGRLGDGIDVRGEGGYVVAPPSLHRSGQAYRWAADPRGGGPATSPDHLPPLPGWLLELAAPTSPTPSPPAAIELRSRDLAAYAAAALLSEVDSVARAPAGQRNHCLNRAAFKLGQLVGAGLLEEGAVTVALVTAGLAAGPGERKIRSTVLRGLRAGSRRPRRFALRTPT